MAATIRLFAAATACLFACASLSLAQPSTTPSGACCLGTLCAVATQATCTLNHGQFAGNATTCSPANPCIPAFGACCITGSCSITTPATCTSGGGNFQGNNTTCSPSTCAQQVPPTTGACCSLDANQVAFCHLETPAACAATFGSFLILGSACTPTTCPQPAIGSCCRVLSNGNACILTSQASCVAAGGTYNGNGTPCTATTCPQLPLGTCCYAATAAASSRCVVVRSNLCTGVGATFSAASTSCATSTCPRTCACDFNFDGILNSYDVVQFTNAYLAGNGDFDGNGTTDVNDAKAFEACYVNVTTTVGCVRVFDVPAAGVRPPRPPVCPPGIPPWLCGREIPLPTLLLVAIAPAAWIVLRRRGLGR